MSCMNEADLNMKSNWLQSNKLSLNTDKSEFMLTGSRQRLQSVKDDIHNVSVTINGIYINVNIQVSSLMTHWHGINKLLLHLLASFRYVLTKVTYQPSGNVHMSSHAIRRVINTHLETTGPSLCCVLCQRWWRSSSARKCGNTLINVI